MMKIGLHQLAVFLGTVWGLTFILLMVDTNVSDPNKFVESDYIVDFYPAGHLAATGQVSDLYPGPNDNSIWGSRFDKATHSLLPQLSKDSPAIFRYSPIVAGMFAPLSIVSPHISLLAWQMTSIAALILSCVFLSRTNLAKAVDIVCLSALFFPLMVNLWAGQVSLVLGLLPLSAGYLLLIKGRPFASGLAWSFLALKPQYFLVAAFVAVAQVCAGRLKCFAGVVVGVIGLATANILFFPMEVNMNWVYSLRFSDVIYSSGQYKLPVHLMTSLPMDLLILLPIGSRAMAKLPIYGAVAALWLMGLWQSKRIVNSQVDDCSKMSLILVTALLLLPLTSPHLLYYDLCMFLPAGVILLKNNWPPPQSVSLKRIALVGWISISIYGLVILNMKPTLSLAVVLLMILLLLFVELLRRINNICLSSGPL
jgi:hypothetical protein